MKDGLVPVLQELDAKACDEGEDERDAHQAAEAGFEGLVALVGQRDGNSK